MSENNNQERSVSLSDLSNGAIPTATPVGMPNTNQTPLPKFNSDTAKDLNRREAVLPSEDELPVENFGNLLSIMHLLISIILSIEFRQKQILFIKRV